jgi:hypothetical protein
LCPTNSLINGEGTALTTGAFVSDKAGNLALASSAPVKIDRTPPVTMAHAPGGWTNADVAVSLFATDNLSGVETTSYNLDGATQTYQPGSTISITTEGVHMLQ